MMGAMKRTLLLLVAALSALACRSSSGLGDLPDGRAVVARFVEASGLGDENARPYTSRGRVLMPELGLEGTFVQSAAPPDRYDMRIDLGNRGTTRTAFRDGRGWVESADTGVVWLEGAEALQMRLQAAFDAPAKPGELYRSVEQKGVVEFLGVTCFEVEVVARDLDGGDAPETRLARTTLEYYSVDTGFLRGTRTTAVTHLGEIEVLSELSDYRRFGDQWVACRSVQRTFGSTMEFLIDELTFDTVEPGAFEFPPGTRR